MPAIKRGELSTEVPFEEDVETEEAFDVLPEPGKSSNMALLTALFWIFGGRLRILERGLSWFLSCKVFDTDEALGRSPSINLALACWLLLAVNNGPKALIESVSPTGTEKSHRLPIPMAFVLLEMSAIEWSKLSKVKDLLFPRRASKLIRDWRMLNLSMKLISSTSRSFSSAWTQIDK